MLGIAGSARKRAYSHGFTMVELLLVIVTTGIISIVALPKFLDFRTEARVATAQNYINHLRSALANKKTQMMLYCNQGAEVWPRLEAIEMNDITEAGAPEAACTPDQIPNGEDRKFFAQGDIVVPTNPYNLLSNIEYTTCTDFCACDDEAGFLYNIQTGVVGHKLILDECIGRIPASASSESSDSSDSSEGGGESSSEESSESSESSVCTPSYAMDEELELCQDVSCDEGYVDLSYCDEGGDSGGGGCTLSGVSCPGEYPMIGGSCTDGATVNIDGITSGSIVCGTQYGSGVFEWGTVDPGDYTVSCGSDSVFLSCGSGGETIEGCTDSGANNYDPSATSDDGSCSYDGECGDNAYWDGASCVCNSGFVFDGDSQCVSENPGCTDSGATNYNESATSDDGSCTYDDSSSSEDLPECTCDQPGDVTTCSNLGTFTTFDGYYTTYCASSSSSDGEISGCTDSNATNYDPSATYDDGSCAYESCSDTYSDLYNDGGCYQTHYEYGSCIVASTDSVDCSMCGNCSSSSEESSSSEGYSLSGVDCSCGDDGMGGAVCFITGTCSPGGGPDINYDLPGASSGNFPCSGSTFTSSSINFMSGLLPIEATVSYGDYTTNVTCAAP